MERSYKARYFDGQHSQPFTVELSITNEGLLISYTDIRHQFTQTHWNREEIRQTEFNSSIATLRYGDGFPYQQLEVTDRDFISEYGSRHGRSRFTKARDGRNMWIVAGTVLGILGLCVFGYLVLLPRFVDYAARHVPKDYEISLGRQLYASVLADEKKDTAKTEAINAFFRQMHVEGDYPVEITVVKKEITNAFALPGGGIVVYSGILEKMDNEGELAALLSHEYSHVQLKHATRNIFRSLAGYLFISLLVGDMSGISATILQNAEELRGLSYTRDLEAEADNNGLQILKENRLSAEGMKDLFLLLKKESNIHVNEILSTHPDLENRIRNAEAFEKYNPYTVEKNDSLRYYFKALTKENEWDKE